MSKLKCGGKVIFTCKQLFQWADPVELATQMDDFLSFAITHLNRTQEEHVLIALLKAVRKNQDLNQAVQDLAGEEDALAYYKAMLSHCRSVAAEKRVRTAAVMTAIGRLTKIPAAQMEKLPPQNFLPGAKEKQGTTGPRTLALGEDPDVQISAFSNVYRICCDPSLVPDEHAEIKTYCIRVTNVGSCQETELSFELPSGQQIKNRILPKGGRVYVNAINGVVVTVLPDQAGDLSRTGNGQLRLRDTLLAGSEHATSFACDLSSGSYLWVCDGKTGGTYRSSHNTDITLQYSTDIVEVALRDGYYYLLHKLGIVKTNDPQRKGADGVNSLNVFLRGAAI